MFRYASAWLERQDAFAISPAMPLIDAPFFSTGVRDKPGLALPDPIADASPDAWGRTLINATLGRQRIPYISARTFMGREVPGPVYYTDIADMMVAHCAEPEQQLHELYRRILFNILVSNNDDHLQNHGFLYVGNNRWRLSPAFDINPQPLRHSHLKTGISELSGNAASIEAAVDAAPYFGIAQDTAVKTLKAMLDVIEREWRGLCRNAGMTDGDISYYEPAFTHGEARVAARITGVAVASLSGSQGASEPERDPSDPTTSIAISSS